MGCCSGFARLLLFIFNFLFWLTGVAMLGIGIWIVVDPEIEEYQKVLEDASASGDFLQTAAYILIGFGSFVLLVGLCGCCGAVRKSKCLLGFYIFFLVVIFAGELAAVIYVAIYRSDAEDDLKDGLVKSLKEHYASGLSTAWDEVQEGLKCCGGSGAGDYMNSTWYDSSKPDVQVPRSCCVLENGNPKSLTECQKRTVDFYHTKGCMDALIDWMGDNSTIIIGAGAGIAALQIIIFICAVCFCRHVDEDQ